jgi:hypothetical protein
MLQEVWLPKEPQPGLSHSEGDPRRMGFAERREDGLGKRCEDGRVRVNFLTVLFFFFVFLFVFFISFFFSPFFLNVFLIILLFFFHFIIFVLFEDFFYLSLFVTLSIFFYIIDVGYNTQNNWTVRRTWSQWTRQFYNLFSVHVHVGSSASDGHYYAPVQVRFR